MERELEINVSNENFKHEVLESTLPVLVDFWAEWCGPCRMIGPVVREIAEEYKGKLKVCKLNVDTVVEITSSYNIMSIPTLIIFKDGKAVDRITGAVPKSDIVAKINICIS